MRRPLCFCLLVALLVITGCDGLGSFSESDDRRRSALYSNSFSSAADTAGWKGNGILKLRSEAPEGGGEGSVYVSGGCVGPFSTHEFTASTDAEVVLLVWAKSLSPSGGVWVKNLRTEKRVGVRVRDEAWKLMESEETLAVQAGDTLRVALSAGGFVPSPMLVTQLEVLPKEED